MPPESLPLWWDDLIDWFYNIDPDKLPLNMRHAWRVNRLLAEACNGGLANFFSEESQGFSNAELLQSVAIVCKQIHVATLTRSLQFYEEISDKHPLPEAGQIARMIAYDSLLRGDPLEQVAANIASICPECPEQLRPAVLNAASHDIEAEKHWIALGQEFFEQLQLMEQCVADYAKKYWCEWHDN